MQGPIKEGLKGEREGGMEEGRELEEFEGADSLGVVHIERGGRIVERG